ncbi:MAG: hypothetical protein ABL932_06095 [Terricaulis sp.]
MGDNYAGGVGSTDRYAELGSKQGANVSSLNYPGNRIRAKGEEAREALQCVLSAVQCHVSIEALERAVATVKAHLEADA